MSEEELSRIEREVRSCRKCPLWEGRLSAVPGEGPPGARVMVVGEGPGRNEDMEGKPFVGAAGANLDVLLSEAGLTRADVFITNIVKCRPPMNRRPTKKEADTCYPYLRRQIVAVNPDVILLLGDTALKQFFPESGLSSAHGQRITKDGMTFFPTYHPASVIYNPSLKETLLSDFRELREFLGG